MSKYTTIAVDPETHAKLKEKAGGLPIATYLRDFVGNLSIQDRLAAIEGKLNLIIPDYSIPETDIRQEARELGKKLGYGEKRLQALDIVLEKGTDAEITGAVKHMRDRIAHPERENEFYIRQIESEIAVKFHSSPRAVRELSTQLIEYAEILEGLKPKTRQFIAEYISKKDREPENMTELCTWTQEAILQLKAMK